MTDTVRLRVNFEGDEASKFLFVQNRLGLKNSTEVVRYLIHRAFQNMGPDMEHYNLSEHGVRVLDRNINRIVDVSFRPEGITCEHCESGNCKHVEFVLTVPKVQSIIRARRKDGWDLPEV